MKKIFTAVALVIALITSISVVAFAQDTAPDGGYCYDPATGKFYDSFSCENEIAPPEGVTCSGSTVTLNGVDIAGNSFHGLCFVSDVTLIVHGTNKISITPSGKAYPSALYFWGNNSTIKGDGTLEVCSNGEGSYPGYGLYVWGNNLNIEESVFLDIKSKSNAVVFWEDDCKFTTNHSVKGCVDINGTDLTSDMKLEHGSYYIGEDRVHHIEIQPVVKEEVKTGDSKNVTPFVIISGIALAVAGIWVVTLSRKKNI